MILVYGTVCLDRVLRVPRIPAPGGYISVESESWRLGGEAANTAFALKSWGADFRFHGNHLGAEKEPNDPTREQRLLWELLETKGLAEGRELARTASPPVCDIYVTPDGERTMFGFGFDTMYAELQLIPHLLDGVDWFCIDMNFGAFGWEWVHLARERNVRCYLMDFVDPADPIPVGSVWHSSTDWIGSKTHPKMNLDLVDRIAHDNGVIAVLTDGHHGCYYAAPGQKPKHEAPIIHPKIVDATGAGDTFRAGMLFGLDKGWELERCVRFASVAGSLKCQYPGATTQQATLMEIEAAIGAG
jgi:sugar/nucleoside kinase (ribokinase family)